MATASGTLGNPSGSHNTTPLRTHALGAVCALAPDRRGGLLARSSPPGFRGLTGALSEAKTPLSLAHKLLSTEHGCIVLIQRLIRNAHLSTGASC